MVQHLESDFARLITKYRQQKGMSQGQLAQATRLSRTYIYHLESGQRHNPSPHVAQLLARALELFGAEKEQFYQAYTRLTGQLVDTETATESALLELGELARLLVHNTSYPAHSLNRLWYLHSWNKAALELFEIAPPGLPLHLLEFVFDPHMRKRFHGWEHLARRLVSDFQYNTSTVTHLPGYKELRKRLRTLPEFKRIAAATYPAGKPAPSFVFQIQHSQLGRLTLRTATTVFTGIANYSMVSYVPGDQHTLKIYRQLAWQPQEEIY